MAERSEPQGVDPKDRRVLVVDDDEDVREMLCDVARREGFQVESAADGREALAAVARAAPDLIVLDLMLPRLGGYEVLKRLQGDGRGTPVLVVTGRYTDPSTAGLIRQEKNVADFLEKPVQPAALAAALHRVLRTRSQV